jgi:mono/diheme cytochrome c family protein
MAGLSAKHALVLALAVLSSGALAACGSQEIDLDEGASARIRDGAMLFNDKCSGCHTFEPAGAQGSAFDVRNRERVDGPNFDTRPETVEAVLFAIRNGGFSGAIMPENIVVGDEAQKVAEFIAEYAGRDAELPVTPNAGTPGTDDQQTP